MVIVFFTFHNVSINTIGRLRDGHLKQFALHSTMFLLIQRCSICLSYCYTTLHSTMFLLIPSVICPWSAHSFQFTFHNVSINTKLMRMDSTMEKIFTFHNVSINTFWLEWRKPAIKYLHSTMFLLIPNITGWSQRKCVHLHSTMFLLIRKCTARKHFQSRVFTFHNVSINTDQKYDYCIRK